MEPVLDDATLLAAGRLCLDFVNTFCFRLGAPLELLGNPEMLDLWLRSAEKWHGKRIDVPWRAAHGERSLRRALELREALLEITTSVREARAPHAEALGVLNAVLRETPSSPQLLFKGGFDSGVHANRTDDVWLWEIARDAAEFFPAADPSLLRQCEHETCIRVFYDTTKNHTRRWCVEKCGSRVKAAAYYRRKRDAKASASS
jgi:predicted RNA-binding Zn ribbon-like protein